MKKLSYLFLLPALFFMNCANDGEPGPQGLKGDQGEQGPKGDQGDQGPQGAPGTANVMYSEWVSPDWYESSANYLIWYQTDPNMTEEIVDQGMILIYFKDNTYNHVMNIEQDLGDVSFTMIMKKYSEVSPESYTIYLGAYSVDASDLTNLKNNYKFRYVLIPGSVLTGERKAAVKFENYEEVKTLFNIPD